MNNTTEEQQVEIHPFFTTVKGKRCVYEPDTKKAYSIEDVLAVTQKEAIEGVLRRIGKAGTKDEWHEDQAASDMFSEIAEIRAEMEGK